MQALDKGGLTSGSRLTLGSELVIANTEMTRSGLRLIALTEGEPTKEYVVIVTRFTHGDTVEPPTESAIPLHVSSGTGMSSPIAHWLIDVKHYGGD